jgi:tyrosine-protein kinase Etk/Wzc
MKPGKNPKLGAMRWRSIRQRMSHQKQLFALFLGGALVLGLLFGALYPKQYRLVTLLLIESHENRLAGGEAHGELTQARNLQNEMALLRSRELIEATVLAKGLQVSWQEKGFWGNHNYSGLPPVKMLVDQVPTPLYETPIELELISRDSFRLWVQTDPAFALTGAFGQWTQQESLRLKLFPRESLYEQEAAENRLSFVIHRAQSLADAFAKRLEVESTQEGASMLRLSLEGTVPGRDSVFLNGLTDQYLQGQLAEKRRFAEGTLDFVDAQLRMVADSLDGTVDELAANKAGKNTGNRRPNISSVVGQLKRLQTEKGELEAKLAYQEELISLLQNEGDPAGMVAPASLGIDDPMLNESVLTLKRQDSERLIKSVAAGEESLEMQYLNRQVKRSSQNLLAMVQTIRNSTEQEIAGLERRISGLSRGVRDYPGNGQLLDQLESQFNFNDQLYNYLLEKRMEASLVLANVEPEGKVLDLAFVAGGGPSFPVLWQVLLFSVLLGGLLPLLWVVGQSMLDATVMEAGQIEQSVQAPVLGHVLHAPQEVQNGNLWADENALAIAENFRYLFVKLQFILPEKPCKVIALTSTVPDEGKTFCAANLAQIMASTGKRVVIMGADVRKPRLHKHLFIPNQKGLTNYLSRQAGIEEIVQDTSLKGLSCITSGPIPTDPAELLDSPRLPQLIRKLEERFDYIIIDTPPAGLFADFLQLSPCADINLYVVRQRYSKLELLDDIEQLRSLADMKHFYLIFNDVRYGNGYRTKYGYDYGDKYRDEGERFNASLPSPAKAEEGIRFLPKHDNSSLLVERPPHPGRRDLRP